MDIDDLRALDAAMLGNDYPDDVLEAVLPFVQHYLDSVAALRAVPVAEVPNALVLAAGGRK